MADWDETTPVSKVLRYQAAKLGLGTLNADDIKSTIHALVDSGVYLDEFLDALDARKPRLDEVLPAFLAALAHEGASVPDKDQAVWDLIEFHLQEIVLATAVPLAQLQKLIADVYWDCDFHTPTKEYLGDSHGIEHLIGLYWAADDLRDDPENISLDGQLGEAAWAELNDQIVVKARHWLSSHRPSGKFAFPH